MRLPTLLALTLLLAGCSGDTGKLQPLGKDAVILAFGDSLTFGTGAPREQSYPAILARLTGRKVINAGVPGEVSAKGVQRLPGLLKQHNPDLVILCHGANDLLRKMNKQSMAENLRIMIRTIQGHGADVILLGVPTPRLAFRSTAPVYGEIAKEFRVPYEGDIIAELEDHAALKSDPIHFNGKGNQRLAAIIHDLIRKHGGLP